LKASSIFRTKSNFLEAYTRAGNRFFGASKANFAELSAANSLSKFAFRLFFFPHFFGARYHLSYFAASRVFAADCQLLGT